MSNCETLSSITAGLVQQMNIVHVLIQQEKYREASSLLAIIQAREQILAGELWHKYHRSGEGHAA
jgi:hypothetical protein